jgi:hypothetical protein
MLAPFIRLVLGARPWRAPIMPAFANLARGLRPGGRLVLVCWQSLVDNEWVTVPAAAAQHIPLPSPTDPGSPGPFSLSDRHHLAAMLDATGLGRDIADTVQSFKASGIGQTPTTGRSSTCPRPSSRARMRSRSSRPVRSPIATR